MRGKVKIRETGAKEGGKGDKERLDTFFVSFLSSVAGEALLEAKEGLRAVDTPLSRSENTLVID